MIRDNQIHEDHCHPFWVFLLGFFLPGTGQLINYKIKKAAIIFIIWSIFWILHISPWWVLIHFIAGIDAGCEAWKIRKNNSITEE